MQLSVDTNMHHYSNIAHLFNGSSPHSLPPFLLPCILSYHEHSPMKPRITIIIIIVINCHIAITTITLGLLCRACYRSWGQQSGPVPLPIGRWWHYCRVKNGKEGMHVACKNQYGCVYVCMCVCINARMHIWFSVYLPVFACIYVCMHGWMNICMHGWMHEGMNGKIDRWIKTMYV